MKASDPDCIPLVALKNCEPELSDIQANSSICVTKSLVFQFFGLLGGPCI